MEQQHGLRHNFPLSISALHVMEQVYVVICSMMDGCGFTAAPCVLVSPTNHRRRLHPTRNATSYSVPLLRTQPLCHRHPPCWLYIPHAVLYPSDIVNSAPSRTIQARNHIVRVPAIVRVLWFGTYPHYRGHPTVLRICSLSSTAVQILYPSIRTIE